MVLRKGLAASALILICILIFNCVNVAGLQAAVPSASIDIQINGQTVKCDVPPFIDSNNRTMVPLRFIAEALGATVQWQATEKKIIIAHKNQDIQLRINSRSALINGKTQALDTSPVLKNDRTMVPLRFIAEQLGTQIDWLSETRTVDVEIPVQTRQGQVVISADTVNLRSGPGTIFERVGQAGKGEVFNLVGQALEWCQITTSQNDEAWVFAELVETQPGTTPSRGDVDNPREDPSDRAEEDYLTVTDVQTKGSVTSLTVKAVQNTPRSFLLQSPQRLVFDFDGSVVAPENINKPINVGSSLVTSVRLGQFTDETARVVIDLKGPCSFSVSNSKNDTCTIKIEPPTLKGKVVVIDPGHGNIKPDGIIDPGAIGPTTGLYERDVVMDVGLQVSNLLKAKGIKTVLTRNGNASITLEDRVQIASQAKADVFVSIHANSSERSTLNGTMVFFSAPSDSGLGGLRGQSQALATSIHDQLIEDLGRHDLGVREEEFYVLRNNSSPSALVEIAFLSYPEEERLLNSSSFRKKAASAITEGILDYLLGK